MNSKYVNSGDDDGRIVKLLQLVMLMDGSVFRVFLHR